MYAERQRGFTLIELLIAIVVIGVGLAGVLVAFTQVGKNNASPVVHKQMLAIAEEMLEEIATKPFAAAANAAPAGCARDTFNDVLDYNGYATNQKICAVDGTSIAALSGYAVAVQVSPGALSGVSAALRIQVTVTAPGESLVLVAWRTNYAN
ncbi:MAG TPA: prepilin-type N-terminal cleavage/methylation domain-containing protein [Burkholderiaceae bacterium]|jgi:MSHA pilin protein MshD